MVQKKPLCRLEKSNDPSERQVEAVSKRFDKILDKLDILQQRVNIAASKNNVDLSQSVTSRRSSSLVIHAHPSQPPHSLSLILPHLTSCFVSTHIHSSVTSVTKPSLILNTVNKSRSECDLKITLIYMDVPQTRTILSPTRSILGEVNLMRYLARLSANQLYEDNSKHINKIDQILDGFAVNQV